MLTELLGWLWDFIAAPVMAALALDRTPDEHQVSSTARKFRTGAAVRLGSVRK